MKSVLLVAALAVTLTGCDYGERLKQLESKTADLGNQVGAQAAEQRRLAADVETARAEIADLRAIISVSSRLRVAVEPGGAWKTVYANSTGSSQLLRLTHVAGDGADQLALRAQPVKAEPSIPGDPNSLPLGASAEWDLSPVGAQRWVRLMCGLEIKGRSAAKGQVLDVFVSKDPNPVSCDQSR